jgi:site-specific recombinase XerD
MTGLLGIVTPLGGPVTVPGVGASGEYQPWGCAKAETFAENIKMKELEQFLISNGWSAETRGKYGRVLRRLLNDIDDLGEMTAGDLAEWLEEQDWGNSQKCVALTATRNWLRYKYGESHPAMELKIKRPRSKPQRSLSMDQVNDLLAHFDTSTKKGRRDLAMCSLFLDTGLRVSEIVRLEMQYLDVEERRLSVIVKGGEWEEAVFSPYTASCLCSWLGCRETVAKPGVTEVFISVGGNTPGTGMTRDGVGTVVKYWGQKSGVGKLSPHDFRRTFATIGSRLGASERVLMEAGRWRSSEMIKRYTSGIEAKDMDPYSPVMAAMDLR